MNPKAILQNFLRQSGDGALPRLRTRAAAAARASGVLLEAFSRLTMPLLGPGERLQLKDAAALGIPQFFRAYERILGSSPALQQALQAQPDYFVELRSTHAALLRIAELAARLSAGADAGEHVALVELRELLVSIEDTAAQLATAPDTDPQTRRQADGVCRFLAAYRERFAQAERTRQLRARRHASRARERQAALLHEVEIQELKRELIGAPPPGTPPVIAAPPAGTAPPPRRRGETAEDALLPEGAPIDRCLESPARDYAAFADELEALIEELSLPELGSEERAGAEADPLLDGDLAALLGEVLPRLRWLTQASGAAPEALHEHVDLLDGLAQLRAAASLLGRGARDGALVLGKLALITHDEAQAFLRGRGDGESRRLRLQTTGALEVLRRGEAQKAQVVLGGQRRAAQVDAETAERLGEAAAARTAARVEAGEEVGEEELRAAVQRKRETQGAAQPVARSRRKRPR